MLCHGLCVGAYWKPCKPVRVPLKQGLQGTHPLHKETPKTPSLPQGKGFAAPCRAVRHGRKEGEGERMDHAWLGAMVGERSLQSCAWRAPAQVTGNARDARWPKLWWGIKKFHILIMPIIITLMSSTRIQAWQSAVSYPKKVSRGLVVANMYLKG